MRIDTSASLADRHFRTSPPDAVSDPRLIDAATQPVNTGRRVAERKESE